MSKPIRRACSPGQGRGSLRAARCAALAAFTFGALTAPASAQNADCAGLVVSRYDDYAAKYGAPIENEEAIQHARELVAIHALFLENGCYEGTPVVDWLARSIWIATNIEPDPRDVRTDYYLEAAESHAAKAIDAGLETVAGLRATLELPHREQLLADVMALLRPLIIEWSDCEAMPVFKQLPTEEERQRYDQRTTDTCMKTSLARAWKHPLQASDEAVATASQSFARKVAALVSPRLYWLSIVEVLQASPMSNGYTWGTSSFELYPPIVTLCPDSKTSMPVTPE